MKTTLLFIIIFNCLNLFSQNLDSGLVVHYPFDGNTNDISINGNNGTNHGATLTTDRYGIPNSAYYFADGDYIDANPSILPSGGDPRTISIWLETDGSLDSDVPIGWGKTSYANAYGIALGTSLGSPKGFRHFGWAADIQFDYTYPDNTWFNIITTYDGDTACFYYNGVLINKKAKGNWNTILDVFYIGKNLNSSSNDHFKGKIDDVRIWGRPLGNNEIEFYLGVNDISLNKFISVSPNPTTGSLFLNANNVIIKRLDIYNILGEKVIESANSSLIDLYDYRDGTYILMIYDQEDRLINTQKIIKY